MIGTSLLDNFAINEYWVLYNCGIMLKQQTYLKCSFWLLKKLFKKIGNGKFCWNTFFLFFKYSPFHNLINGGIYDNFFIIFELSTLYVISFKKT